ncbi:MAG TPA: hypothetical protein PKA00_03845 [Saprospiraceae bacterium]|nr:hypothetical protein [Saprospiraceae bacterium]HMQ82010.1 hypothetical protein [Saprospiraceae bacterium]
MKKSTLLLIFFLALLMATAYGQTYIGPVLGIEHTQLYTDEDYQAIFNQLFFCPIRGEITTQQPLFGINVEQHLSNRFFLQGNFYFSKRKYFNEEYTNFCPHLKERIIYRHFNGAMSINWRMLERWTVESGIYQYQHSNLKITYDSPDSNLEDSTYIFDYREKAYGVLLGASYRYPNYVVQITISSKLQNGTTICN